MRHEPPPHAKRERRYVSNHSDASAGEVIDAETGEVLSVGEFIGGAIHEATDGLADWQECERLTEEIWELGRGIQRNTAGMGERLRPIRDRRMYRWKFSDFATYCAQKLGVSERHANRLINYKAMVERLGPVGPEPLTERAMRELMPLQSDEPALVEVYEELKTEYEGFEVAAEKVRRLVQKRLERERRERDAAARAQNEAYQSEYVVGEAEIKHMDFRNLTLPDESVPLIFTDPPYPGDYLHLWKDLGKWAYDALRPGGVLVAYTGQWYLPQVISALSEHLDYLWLGGVVAHGPATNIHPIQIRNEWKGLLFFGKREYKPSLNWADDLLYAEKWKKESHEWQQAIGPAKYFIERLTKSADLVVDPFVGGGSFAIAALEAGRSFLGCELDQAAYKHAGRRVKDWKSGHE
jgi:SAM-dependent methyltransferase